MSFIYGIEDFEFYFHALKSDMEISEQLISDHFVGPESSFAIALKNFENVNSFRSVFSLEDRSSTYTKMFEIFAEIEKLKCQEQDDYDMHR